MDTFGKKQQQNATDKFCTHPIAKKTFIFHEGDNYK